MDFDMNDAAEWITNFGNLVVVGPAAVLVWVWILYRRGFWAALRYQWPVATTFVLTVALKYVSRAVGGVFVGTPFALSTGAPSGHVGMSTVVYGGVALMLLRRGAEPIALLGAFVTALMLAGIAITRVTLHYHTPGDVAAGFLLGGACALWMGAVAEVPAREPLRYIGELVVMLAGIVVVMHLSGLHFDSIRAM